VGASSSPPRPARRTSRIGWRRRFTGAGLISPGACRRRAKPPQPTPRPPPPAQLIHRRLRYLREIAPPVGRAYSRTRGPASYAPPYAAGRREDYWIVNPVKQLLEARRQPVGRPSAPYGWHSVQFRCSDRPRSLSPDRRAPGSIRVADLIFAWTRNRSSGLIHDRVLHVPVGERTARRAPRRGRISSKTRPHETEGSSAARDRRSRLARNGGRPAPVPMAPMRSGGAARKCAPELAARGRGDGSTARGRRGVEA